MGHVAVIAEVGDGLRDETVIDLLGVVELVALSRFRMATQLSAPSA
jgi:hypothetical protein